jgi:hypothetical protein
LKHQQSIQEITVKLAQEERKEKDFLKKVEDAKADSRTYREMMPEFEEIIKMLHCLTSRH